ncbi:FAD-binding protein [Hoeflea sp. TYP-13]|uniref:FAD-binding oxidoreductase n=1 Tax=Hoeflea sp. TYP-13 TaxID=3230023 RepID=UPI0034C6A562
MSYDSWGRNVRARRKAREVSGLTAQTLRDGVSWLPYGNGRSYGDSCHNSPGCLIDSRAANRILSFDENSGELICEAGVLLSDVLDYAIPRGFFLPVTPGTRFVTVGGAIANDVHGKNHHVRGTFGSHVSGFNLLRSDGRSLECSADINSDLFAATIGGMGLTGLITRAAIRLMKVGSADIQQRTLRFDRIDDYFERCAEFDNAHEYAVAWIDQLAKGRKFGRGLLLGGDHMEDGAPMKAGTKQVLSVPFTSPVNLLNNLTLKLFNEAFFRKEKAGEHVRNVSWQSYFYPLDAIGHWNRLYGPRGLFQHQSVYPELTGYDTTVKLMECAQTHGHASFLTVLKRFGTIKSPGVFSFPRPGFTLTLDFANQGERTLRLLDALDDIVVAAGGAVNPYKDARMRAATFEASFPNWRALEEKRDPVMMSDFWSRTAMTFAGAQMGHAASF